MAPGPVSTLVPILTRNSLLPQGPARLGWWSSPAAVLNSTHPGLVPKLPPLIVTTVLAALVNGSGPIEKISGCSALTLHGESEVNCTPGPSMLVTVRVGAVSAGTSMFGQASKLAEMVR